MRSALTAAGVQSNVQWDLWTIGSVLPVKRVGNQINPQKEGNYTLKSCWRDIQSLKIDIEYAFPMRFTTAMGYKAPSI